MNLGEIQWEGVDCIHMDQAERSGGLLWTL